MQLSGFVAGPFHTNTYLFTDDTRAVVVDPGMYSASRVVESLRTHGLELEKILLTHGHIDHTRDAAELGQLCGAPVYIHEADAPMLASGDGVSPQTRQLFDAAAMPLVQDLQHVVDGETIDILGEEFKVLHAPGHSPGSVLYVGSDVALVGDVIFRGAIGRTDLPGSNHEDMKRTLAGPVWSLADHLTLLPGHGAVTTMATERVSNPYLAGTGL